MKSLNLIFGQSVKFSNNVTEISKALVNLTNMTLKDDLKKLGFGENTIALCYTPDTSDHDIIKEINKYCSNKKLLDVKVLKDECGDFMWILINTEDDYRQSDEKVYTKNCTWEDTFDTLTDMLNSIVKSESTLKSITSNEIFEEYSVISMKVSK